MISKADIVVLIHFLFVLFVLFGGLLCVRWPRMAWLHIPAAAWGAAIEFSGWICPLTPLENRLRSSGGETLYEQDFVARYILPALYPDGLTRTHQIVLGAVVLTINFAVYAWIFARARARRSAPSL